MACPFFMPSQRWEEGGWLHRSRLPLGDGWRGCCTAPGHEGEIPSDTELRDGCNLGYAHGCGRLPVDRVADAVNLSVVCDAGDTIEIRIVLQREHRPAGQDSLTYNTAQGVWMKSHPDARVQKMAACYLESYLLLRNPAAASAD